MKKVFQTITDKDNGNCMQAVVASLFELSLEEVPNFIEFNKKEDTNHVSEMWKFFEERGYNFTCINRMPSESSEKLISVAKFDGGINGYFYGSVESQTFPGVSHAVVIDSDLNIVHDPNPNQLALNLKPDDVNGFIAVTEFVIGKTGKLFRMDEWDNATKEERDENVFSS